MDVSVTVVCLPRSIELAAGLAAIEGLSDNYLVALAPSDVLGWGWDLPTEDPFPSHRLMKLGVQ